MIQLIRYEFRKLLTLRSTYVVALFALALLVLFGFYISGIRMESYVGDSLLLNSTIMGSVNFTATLSAVVAILMVAHEYRYNTIMHTITLARSRWTVVASKFVVATIFGIVFVALAAVLAVFLTRIGLAVGGSVVVPQTIYYHDFLRVIFYGWGETVLGLMLAFFIRNLSGSIVTLFFLPVVESLLSLLLKSKAVYLPNSALNGVLNQTTFVGATQVTPLSYGQAASVFMLYMVIGWIAVVLLFNRRDAN